MATSKVTKDKKTPVKKAVKAKSIAAPVIEPVEAVIPAPIELFPIVSSMYGKIEFATSMNLRRRRVQDAYYAKMFIPAELYTDLNTIGIEHGATWDEIVRGAIELIMRDADAYEKLKNHLPINFNVPSL